MIIYMLEQTGVTNSEISEYAYYLASAVLSTTGAVTVVHKVHHRITKR